MSEVQAVSYLTSVEQPTSYRSLIYHRANLCRLDGLEASEHCAGRRGAGVSLHAGGWWRDTDRTDGPAARAMQRCQFIGIECRPPRPLQRTDV